MARNIGYFSFSESWVLQGPPSRVLQSINSNGLSLKFERSQRVVEVNLEFLRFICVFMIVFCIHVSYFYLVGF